VVNVKLINDKVIKLFSEKNLVFIATLMEDGSPQLSPVWANYNDGGELAGKNGKESSCYNCHISGKDYLLFKIW